MKREVKEELEGENLGGENERERGGEEENEG